MKQEKQPTLSGSPQFTQDENPINLSEETRVVYSEEINPHDG